jgi:hypothetical protein
MNLFETGQDVQNMQTTLVQVKIQPQILEDFQPLNSSLEWELSRVCHQLRI